jgi:hypothetical protein
VVELAAKKYGGAAAWLGVGEKIFADGNRYPAAGLSGTAMAWP